MKKTLEFIDFINEKGRACDVWHYVMTPFSGKEIWEIAKQRGKVSDDMNWGELSHFNVDNPMLLEESISKEEFKDIFNKAKAKTDRVKVKFHWLMQKLKYDKMRLMKLALSNPRRVV